MQTFHSTTISNVIFVFILFPMHSHATHYLSCCSVGHFFSSRSSYRRAFCAWSFLHVIRSFSPLGDWFVMVAQLFTLVRFGYHSVTVIRYPLCYFSYSELPADKFLITDSLSILYYIFSNPFISNLFLLTFKFVFVE